MNSYSWSYFVSKIYVEEQKLQIKCYAINLLILRKCGEYQGEFFSMVHMFLIKVFWWWFYK